MRSVSNGDRDEVGVTSWGVASFQCSSISRTGAFSHSLMKQFWPSLMRRATLVIRVECGIVSKLLRQVGVHNLGVSLVDVLLVRRAVDYFQQFDQTGCGEVLRFTGYYEPLRRLSHSTLCGAVGRSPRQTNRPPVLPVPACVRAVPTTQRADRSSCVGVFRSTAAAFVHGEGLQRWH